ncbi:hypothetical protein TRVA0_007S02630 [Trichomonascus vanleenenianus]|uniref:Art10p n=1 Tax=Trichomonascus vanleenenianus TaxID=2268995 RepID=UPI003EC96E1A
MSSTIQVDLLSKERTFSSGDVIRGRATVNLSQETTVKSITVKVEGVAKTVVPMIDPMDTDGRLGRRERRSKKDSIEIHKVLYLSQDVFPPRDVSAQSSTNQFTLAKGSHTYDFEFRLPLKACCADRKDTSFRNNPTVKTGVDIMKKVPIVGGIVNNGLPQVMMSNGRIDFAYDPSGHIQSFLPPSFSGLGDLASVKYFLKVTINRASMFKMNVRQVEPFVFLPADVPMETSSQLAFVRREVTVGLNGASPGQTQPPQKKKSTMSKLFRLNFSESLGVNTWSGPTANFIFEARYPQLGGKMKAGFKPEAPLELHLFVLFKSLPKEIGVTELNVVSIDINLYAHTEATAQGYAENSNLVLNLCKRDNIKLPVDLAGATQSRAIDKETGRPMYKIEIDPDLVQAAMIPDHVPPTFTSCNIRRSYRMGIVAGFSTGGDAQTEYAELAVDSIVQSGIALDNNKPALPQRPAPPNEKAQYTTNTGQPGPMTSEGQKLGKEDQLPSYDEVLSEQAQTADSAVASSTAPRRKFGQSEDYYKGIGTDD